VGFILCSRDLRPGIWAARQSGQTCSRSRRDPWSVPTAPGFVMRADLDERHGGPSRFDVQLAAKRDPRASVEGRPTLPVSCGRPARSHLEELVARGNGAEDL
jgi:hypothetical protein